MNTFQLYLASTSPRRLELLRQIGLQPIVLPQGLDELEQPRSEPGELVQRLAEAKGRRAAERLGRPDPPGVILAADTVVTIDGDVLGKPTDADDARAMLRRLRGRMHEVLTAVFLMRTDDRRWTCQTETTHVKFRDYDETFLRGYVATREPWDKAGSYAIQGRGVLLSERIEGSWTNVVGLPVERLPPWLGRIDLRLESLRCEKEA